jgi:hypothetical protein
LMRTDPSRRGEKPDSPSAVSLTLFSLARSRFRAPADFGVAFGFRLLRELSSRSFLLGCRHRRCLPR